MDQLLVQRTRYVLRSRIRRVQTCPDVLFVPSCVHLIEWIDSHPLLSVIANRLKSVPGSHHEDIDRITREAPSARSYDPGRYKATTSDQHASLCLKTISTIVVSQNLDGRSMNMLLRCFREYMDGEDSVQLDEAIKVLKDVVIDGLYEYIDEQLDARNAIYAILLKYQQRCEWFRRQRLRVIADDGLENRQGERALAIDLQEYILDQGAEFFIEPTSGGGEVDLILRAPEGRYLIVDAKYIPEEATRSIIRDKLAAGSHQVTQYCADYNEPEGFLIIFNRSGTRITIDGLGSADGFFYITIGGKTIYHIEINIADSPSASRLGTAREVVITLEELKYVEQEPLAAIPATL